MNSTDLLYVAFKRQVIALDKRTGKIVWDCDLAQGVGFVAMLVEDGRVYASCNGYTSCLDAVTGKFIWHNELKGMGIGIPCLATAKQNTQINSAAAATAAADDQARSQDTNPVYIP